MTTLQQPLGSGFTAASTASDVLAGVDLTGKTAVVTGGYSGIGVETVRALRAAGAAVVVPARDEARAAEALASVDGIEFARLDLLDPASIDAFARAFTATGRPLHMLVNSAGVMATPLRRDPRGHEFQFATNHLGHFHLTAGLWPALRRAGGARVVAVSSWGHRRSDVLWDDPDFEKTEYDRYTAYGQSKTANNLFAVEVDRRGRGDGVRGFALHPGSIVTPLARHSSVEDLRRLGVIDEAGHPILDPARNLKTPPQGAATSVWCAASPQLAGRGGVYCENSDIAPAATADDAARYENELADHGSFAFGVMPYSVDPASAERLWDLSSASTGVTLP